MDKDKYRIETYAKVSYLFKDNACAAKFYDIPLARKVCDLLNETSRSQGKYPQFGDKK